MSVLLVGFDSAWTTTKSGTLVGAIHLNAQIFLDPGAPEIADYHKAGDLILQWQADLRPTSAIVSVDQPTNVKNAAGQRPVENIVGSLLGRQWGAMQ